jgi:hypothetical protein
MSVTVTESVSVTLLSPAQQINVSDSVNVIEAITSNPLVLPGISVNDSTSVAESVGRNLICLIKPRTTTGATFGKTGIGGTESNKSGDYMEGCKFTSGSAGTLASIKAYLKGHGDTRKMKCAIYDSGYNLLTNGTTEEKTISSTTAAWYTFNFSTAPSVSASTDYYLMMWNDHAVKYYYDSGASGQFPYYGIAYGGSWPASFTPDGSSARDASIYATYMDATTGPLELISITESISRKLNSLINVNDTTSVSDVDAIQIFSLFSLSVYDSVNLSESIGRNLTIPNLSVSDVVSAAESINSIATLAGINVSESVSVAEFVKAALILLISKSESVSIAESVSAKADLGEISVSDAIQVLEKVYFDLWLQRIKETDAWTQRTKETDTWTERTKETDTWDERENKESA